VQPCRAPRKKAERAGLFTAELIGAIKDPARIARAHHQYSHVEGAGGFLPRRRPRFSGPHLRGLPRRGGAGSASASDACFPSQRSVASSA